MQKKSPAQGPRAAWLLPPAHPGFVLPAVCAIASFHLWALPTVLTFDSQQYLYLADLLGSPAPWTRWDPLRTPLFMILLKGAFLLLGRNAWAWLLLQGGFAAATAMLVHSALRRAGHPRAAALAALLVALCPTLVAYQHMLLTEMASGFFLTLLAWLLAAPGSRPWPRTAALTAAAIAACYCRPTFATLIPVLGLLRLIQLHLARQPAGSLRLAWLHALVVALAPALAAWPWLQWSERTGRSAQQLLYGVIRQAVLDARHPLLHGVEARYSAAAARAAVHGRLPACGLRDNDEYPLMGAVSPRVRGSLVLLLDVIRSSPARYADGVLRTLRCYALPPEDRSENHLLRTIVFDRPSSTLFPAIPPYTGAVTPALSRPAALPAAGRAFRALELPFDLAAAAALFCLPFALALGILARDTLLVAWPLLGIAFVAANALVLNPLDRMLVPALPLLLGSLAFLLARLWPRRA
ncbi:MAG: hypothetical protein NZR01_07410 [Bryobacteraceae bacterium]|nr:hypothetical protein [Bryobacteraceae bacterium]